LEKNGASGIITETLNAFRGTDGATLGSEIEKLKYGAAYFPNIETVLNYRYDESDIKIKYFVDNKDENPPKGLVELTAADPDPGIEDLRVSHLTKLPGPDPVLKANIVSGLGLPNTELYNQVKQELQALNGTIWLPAYYYQNYYGRDKGLIKQDLFDMSTGTPTTIFTDDVKRLVIY